jgi:putative transposase
MRIREQRHRLARRFYRGQVMVSFTACISGRHAPFEDGQIVAEFLGIMRLVLPKNKCLVPIYCFMPDHLHLVLVGQDDQSDSWRAMVDFKQRTGFWFANNRPSYSWQKDFHDHIIRADEDLGSHIRYIANNPVRKRLVQRWF